MRLLIWTRNSGLCLNGMINNNSVISTLVLLSNSLLSTVIPLGDLAEDGRESDHVIHRTEELAREVRSPKDTGYVNSCTRHQ